MCPGAPVAAAASDKSVCVMDASGPLGHTLVHRLLRRGYTVHAATYDHSLDALLAAAGHDGDRLKLFRADPFDYHTIADAVRGCSGLFCMFNTHEDQAGCDEVMVEVEVRAAQNVLEACAQTVTMERVVFTSSVTAVVWKDDHKPVDAFDERNWSDLNLCRKRKVAEFAGYVTEHSAFDHCLRQPSPASTIIGMAQDFVGNNNINLLKPPRPVWYQTFGRQICGNTVPVPRHWCQKRKYLQKFTCPTPAAAAGKERRRGRKHQRPWAEDLLELPEGRGSRTWADYLGGGGGRRPGRRWRWGAEVENDREEENSNVAGVIR